MQRTPKPTKSKAVSGQLHATPRCPVVYRERCAHVRSLNRDEEWGKSRVPDRATDSRCGLSCLSGYLGQSDVSFTFQLPSAWVPGRAVLGDDDI